MSGIKTEGKAVKRNNRGYFLEGTIAGPGRPKGSKSIKDAVRKYLEDNPVDFQDFIRHFINKNRELAWQMLEGRPPQDVTSGGEKIKQIPIYAGLSKHDSDKEDILSEEED